MFGSEMVRDLDLSFVVGNPIWDAEEGKYSIVIQNVNLYLYGATPGHPTELKEYRVSDNRSKFWFRRSGWFSPGTQDSVWAIVLWADSPQGSRETPRASQPATWGAIKAIYR
jgi:hypothetical protein